MSQITSYSQAKGTKTVATRTSGAEPSRTVADRVGLNTPTVVVHIRSKATQMRATFDPAALLMANETARLNDELAIGFARPHESTR